MTGFMNKLHEVSITSKIHWLISHVVDFEQKWSWWGLMSEHGRETIFTILCVRYANAETSKRNGEKLIKHQTLLNAIFYREIVNG